ncbi:MAG: carboxylesterase family protein [Planctomycetes bacterium]|nr:carboxylesterase family protein [Planctomycetota bacterium]
MTTSARALATFCSRLLPGACASALLLGGVSGGGAGDPPTPAPWIAKTTAGLVRGSAADGVVAWLGVPYAAPPMGERRWRPPQPVAAWSGVREATSFAPACVQVGVSMPGEAPPVTSEDCLYLNVWSGAQSADERRPVLVWIHGGGWTNGATSLPLYAGATLAKRGIVFVSIAYRLGPLGFLAHPELSAESGEATSGNYGLMDQIAALAWVQANIAAFGGDPERVTIAGQSAGGMSVSLLMASPRAAGLFHAAIAQSGGVFEPTQLAPGYLLENAEKEGLAYAASLGAGDLAALRAMPAEKLLGGKAGTISHPVIEPHLLPRSPYEAYVAGEVHDVPVLIGSNAEEGNSLAELSRVTAENYSSELQRVWGELPPPLLAAYPFETDAEARAARAAFERDLRFGWDMWAWARLQAKLGRSAFYYRFDHAPPFPAGSVREHWGAAHFAELWYMTGNLLPADGAWTAADRKLADTLMSYWVNFVRDRDPNGPSLPPWPAFDASGQVIVLCEAPRLQPAPVDEALRAFDAVYDAVRGKRFGTPP